MTIKADKTDHFKFGANGEYYAGDHLLVELWGAERLTEPRFIQGVLEQSARAAQASILHSHFHHFGPGEGVSGVTILAESHITIHTWPERHYAAVDIFMCGRCDPEDCVPILTARFCPTEVTTQKIRRGNAPHMRLAGRVA